MFARLHAVIEELASFELLSLDILVHLLLCHFHWITWVQLEDVSKRDCPKLCTTIHIGVGPMSDAIFHRWPPADIAQLWSTYTKLFTPPSGATVNSKKLSTNLPSNYNVPVYCRSKLFVSQMNNSALRNYSASLQRIIFAVIMDLKSFFHSFVIYEVLFTRITHHHMVSWNYLLLFVYFVPSTANFHGCCFNGAQCSVHRNRSDFI